MSHKRIAFLAGFLLAASIAAACSSTSTSSSGMAVGGVRVGEFVWQDLMTDDVARSRAFYEQLFGWTFEQTQRLGRPYFIARSGSTPVGGMAQVDRRSQDEPVAQWISYLAVSDVDAVAARLAGAGGRVLVAPTDVAAHRAAVGVDPQGALFGLVRLGSDSNLPAAGSSAPVGSFFWRDYLAKDADQARVFYGNVAGLGADKQNRSDALLHFVLTRPGPVPVAGIVPIGERKVSPNWLPYVRVVDPTQAATRAEQLGGKILLAANPDIRKGSVAVVTDPSGAAVALQKWPL